MDKREYHKKWREENKEHCLEYSRKYREKNKDKINTYLKKYRSENETYKLKHRKDAKRHRIKYPEEIKARNLANRKLKENKMCELCNNVLAREKHHQDYSKPLKVKWLCIACHKKIHKGD